MKTVSLKSLDVGFSLRDTQHAISRPTEIGSPSEIFVCVTDEGEITGRCCDIGSQLRKAGYNIAADWFAGRSDWGHPVVPPGFAAEHAIFEAVGKMAAAEQQ
jgi:hypothetical protein